MTDIRTLKWYKTLTDEELYDIVYLEATHTESEIPTHARDLLVALAERLRDNKHGRKALSSILPGLKVIIDCVEKTLEGDLDDR